MIQRPLLPQNEMTPEKIREGPHIPFFTWRLGGIRVTLCADAYGQVRPASCDPAPMHCAV